MARVAAVSAERPSGLRSGDRPERVGTPAIEPAHADMGKWMDLNMMAMATRRTTAEFGDLFERAGLTLEQIAPTPSPLSIVVGTPRA